MECEALLFKNLMKRGLKNVSVKAKVKFAKIEILTKLSALSHISTARFVYARTLSNRFRKMLLSFWDGYVDYAGHVCSFFDDYYVWFVVLDCVVSLDGEVPKNFNVVVLF